MYILVSLLTLALASLLIYKNKFNILDFIYKFNNKDTAILSSNKKFMIISYIYNSTSYKLCVPYKITNITSSYSIEYNNINNEIIEIKHQPGLPILINKDNTNCNIKID